MARQGYHAVKYLQSLEKYRDMALLLCFDLNNSNYYIIKLLLVKSPSLWQMVTNPNATGTLRKTAGTFYQLKHVNVNHMNITFIGLYHYH